MLYARPKPEQPRRPPQLPRKPPLPKRAATAEKRAATALQKAKEHEDQSLGSEVTKELTSRNPVALRKNFFHGETNKTALRARTRTSATLAMVRGHFTLRSLKSFVDPGRDAKLAPPQCITCADRVWSWAGWTNMSRFAAIKIQLSLNFQTLNLSLIAIWKGVTRITLYIFFYFFFVRLGRCSRIF